MTSKRKKLKILIQTIDGVGHVNACLGLMEKLLERGHSIVFLVVKNCEKLLDNYPNVTKIVTDIEDDQPKIPGKIMAENIKNWGILQPGTAYDKYKAILNYCKVDKKKLHRNQLQLKEILELHKPDLIIQDDFQVSPYILYSNIPWVRVISNTPTFYDDAGDAVPPGGSGYPLNGDRKEWGKFRELIHEFFYSKEYNEVVEELGFEPYPNDQKLPPKYSLTLFGWPEELAYKGLWKYPDSWINVESFMRETKFANFKIPQSLESVRDKYPGKLIYFSLGSMASGDIEMMKRFIGIFSKTKHRYIVSKGPLHTEFELAENVWGDRYVPQNEILKMVDLVITHGGNNTFTETLVYGKPMIVFPIYVDQYDNAQRIQEVGLGRRMDPYDFKDHELTDAIDELLNDIQLNQRLQAMSKRILAGDRFKKACDQLEALVN